MSLRTTIDVPIGTAGPSEFALWGSLIAIGFRGDKGLPLFLASELRRHTIQLYHEPLQAKKTSSRSFTAGMKPTLASRSVFESLDMMA